MTSLTQHAAIRRRKLEAKKLQAITDAAEHDAERFRQHARNALDDNKPNRAFYYGGRAVQAREVTRLLFKLP